MPLQNLDQLEDAVELAGLAPGPYTGLIARVGDYFRRYAELERQLLGEVWVSYPAHLFDEPLPEGALEAGEALARRERERLDLGEGESGDLMALLDHEGLKVFRPPFPEEVPLEGMFLFDAEAGPCFVVNGSLPPLEGDYVFARLYAHYLVDNDPYSIRLLVRGAEPNESDLRAQAFAAAFLIPTAGLAGYFEALRWKPGTPVDAGTAAQLAAYFEVGYRTLLARLLTLNLIQPDEVSPLLIALEGLGAPAVADRLEEAIPERFTRLALEAHARRVIDTKTLAAYLETDLGSAKRLAGRFRLDDDDEDAGDRASARRPASRAPKGKLES